MIRDSVKIILELALRKHFHNDTVDVSDGYKDKIHVVVVSRKLDGMDTHQQIDMIWDVIDKETNLSQEEQDLISLFMPYGIDQLK